MEEARAKLAGTSFELDPSGSLEPTEVGLSMALRSMSAQLLLDQGRPAEQEAGTYLPAVHGRPSHSFTMRSPLVEASQPPSGLNATLVTSFVWPVSVKSS
jgi:hypothetical protein